MRSHDEHRGREDAMSYRELRLLQELEEQPESSQRELSQRLGIALGLTNTVLRNMAKKGFIRATKAGWKRWVYTLTPYGFSQKLKLTVRYVRRVVDDYGIVRQSLMAELLPLALHRESSVALYGTDEFAELIFLGLRNIGIEEIDIYGPREVEDHKFLGIMVRPIESIQLSDYDKIIISDLEDSQNVTIKLKSHGLPEEKIVTLFSSRLSRKE